MEHVIAEKTLRQQIKRPVPGIITLESPENPLLLSILHNVPATSNEAITFRLDLDVSSNVLLL